MQNDTTFIAPSDVSATPDRRDANLCEISIGQSLRISKFNIILGKALGVLPETELFEPIHNLLRQRPSTDFSYPFWTGMRRGRIEMQQMPLEVMAQ